MRKSAFYFLMVCYALAAFETVFWPYWDYHEAGFVAHILAYMKPVEDGKVKAWLGPGVETDATVLVAGRLAAKALPKSGGEFDWIKGRAYPGCVIAYQQLEVFGPKLPWGEGWKAYGGRRVIVGKGVRIGKWPIDQRFFYGEILPRAPYKEGIAPEDAALTCPEDYIECRVAETCIAEGEYSVLGNRFKTKDGVYMVALPHETLVDYPLFQSGAVEPEVFIKTYRARMAERVMVYPVYQALTLLTLGVLMMLFSRREVTLSLYSLSPESFAIWLLHVTLKSNKTLWDHATMWAVIGVPALPAVAYHHIPEPESFVFFMQLSLCGIFFTAASLWSRMLTDPAKIKTRERDVTL